jgi:hypothetical protein
MESNEVVSQIQSLFDTACRDLLVSLNCSVLSLNDEDIDFGDAPIACIDAGSEELELNVGIQMPLTVLSMTYPVPNIIDVDEESLEDWLSELSNQLIGRLKTKLLRQQVEITLGLPASYFGISIDHLIASNHHRISLAYEVDGEACAFHLGLELFKDDINLSEEQVDDGDSLLESEIELF